MTFAGPALARSAGASLPRYIVSLSLALHIRNSRPKLQYARAALQRPAFGRGLLIVREARAAVQKEHPPRQGRQLSGAVKAEKKSSTEA
jgi:hypothetical protein